jgi:hypothetical protein
MRNREVETPKVKVFSRIIFVIFFIFYRLMSLECFKSFN